MPKSNVRFCIEGERRKMAKAGLRLCVIRYCILNVFMHGLGDLFAVSNSFYHSLVINNSLTDVTTVNLPKDAQVYALAGRDGMRSTVMTLNGRDLVLDENDELPDLSGKSVPAGKLEIAPGSCTFIVL